MVNKSPLKNRVLIRKKLVERDGPTCRHCPSTETLTIDHIKRRFDGGSNKLSNLQLLCRSCHDKKDFIPKPKPTKKKKPNKTKGPKKSRKKKRGFGHLTDEQKIELVKLLLR